MPSFYVVCADLATREVDAIVNPINPSLLLEARGEHRMGRMAGRSVQRALDTALLSLPGQSLSVGKVITSTAGFLPCKVIIHVSVDPNRPMGGALLFQAVRRCLTESVDLGLKSLAFPCLNRRSKLVEEVDALALTASAAKEILSEINHDIDLIELCLSDRERISGLFGRLQDAGISPELGEIEGYDDDGNEQALEAVLSRMEESVGPLADGDVEAHNEEVVASASRDELCVYGLGHLEGVLEGNLYQCKVVLNEKGLAIGPMRYQHEEIRLDGVRYDPGYNGNAVAGLIRKGVIEILYHPEFSEERLLNILTLLLRREELHALKGFEVVYSEVCIGRMGSSSR